MSIKTTISKITYALPLVAGALFAGQVSAQNTSTNYNRLSFEVTATETVTNDEIHASLAKTVQAKDMAGLAAQINPIINQATALKAKYPEVKVTTGHHHSHPTYDRNGKMTGYTGQASIELVSQNSEQISNYIADLQSSMALESLNFSVSDSLNRQVRDRLKATASQDFMNEAKSLVQLWGARDYRLVSATLGSANQYAYPVAMAQSFKNERVADASAEPYRMEVGDTQISYTINGVIELIK